MNTSIAEINRIVRTNPSELKYLFKSPAEDKRRLTRLISHLVPYRVGIEFETFGSVGSYLYPIQSLKSLNSINGSKEVDKLLAKKLGLVDFREDTHVFQDRFHNKQEGEEIGMNEVRISIQGYKQLIPLYKTLQILNKCLVIPKINGGIHIHIDAPFVRDQVGKDFAVNWFNQAAILSEVLKIFEGYNGTYNARKASKSKASYIRVSSYPTIEFRIGRLTYNYSTLIRYIIKCSELVRRCKTEFISSGNKIQEPTEKKTENLVREFTIELNQPATSNSNTDYIDSIDLSSRLYEIPTSNGRYFVVRDNSEYTTPF